MNRDIALNYLHSRGLTDEMITKFSLHFTDNSCEDKKLRNRIIIPSRDKCGDINYWVGRLYIPNSYYSKYYLPSNVNKKNIIFNEYFLNWNSEVRIVEGQFDSMVIPNCTCLSGKSLNKNFKLFNEIIKRGKYIYLIPDKDDINAMRDIKNNLLKENKRLNITIADWSNVDYPICKDLSDVFEKYGRAGVQQLLTKNL